MRFILKALIRIEHKIDALLYALEHQDIVVYEAVAPLGHIESEECFLCREDIRLVVDMQRGLLHRECGCQLPKEAYKLELISDKGENNE